MNQILFPAIAEITKPKTALEIYKGTYEGKGPNLALITEGEELAKMIMDSAPVHRKTPVPIRRIDLLAENLTAGKEMWADAFKMLAEGFPLSQRIDLYLEVEQGSDQRGDDGMSPDTSTEQTVGSVKFNVFTLCDRLNKGTETMASVHATIDDAYKIGEAAVLNRQPE